MTCANPDCEHGAVPGDTCPTCDQAIYETCPVCKGIPSAPEPRRPVAGWVKQRNGDETWWVLDLAASDAAEFYAIVKQYPDRPLTWSVALSSDEDCAAWAEETADDPDAAMLLAEDAAASLLDAANVALGRVR